jgi:AmmeMemoRadiSam system protein B
MQRKPVVSGTFYESDSSRLRSQLNELFSGTKTSRGFPMVVSPHAGYVYSGRTAARAVSALRPSRTFIILGPNHTGLGTEFSVMSSGSWKTPLGEVGIDGKSAERLKKCEFLREDQLAHSREHSVEVQLPLLQHRFRDFSMVPVSMMNIGYSDDFRKRCEALGHAVAGIVRDGNVGVVASSDFSHYLPQDMAEEKDEVALAKIMNLDVEGFFRSLHEIDASVCGFGPIAVTMAAAKELGMKAGLIHKSSSGDASGDYGSVVTYCAIGFS